MAFNSLYWIRVLPGRLSVVSGCLCPIIYKGRVEGELSEVYFIDQVMKVPLEGLTIHYEVTPPFVEGIVVSGSRTFWIR